MLKGLGNILLTLFIIGGFTWVFTEGVKAWRFTEAQQRDVDNKENCVAQYNTIKCHELKIERLKLEARFSEVPK